MDQVTVPEPDLEQLVKPGRRTLRSSSSTSTSQFNTNKIEIDLTTLDDALVKEKEPISSDVDSISIIGQNLDSSIEQKPRYSLRKRNSPVSADKQLKLEESIEVQERIITSSSPISQAVEHQDQSKSCPIYTCGYLRYSHRQIINFIIISILMVVFLAVVNYLNENSLKSVFSFLTKLKDNIFHTTSDFYLNLRTIIGF